MTPLVSILMPVRNEENYLPAALDSLFRQTMTEWELVVVDDGSTDATSAILAAAAGMDHRVRPIIATGTGLVSALNEGLSHCSAPLVARMDGDDICHPRRLELQHEHFRTNSEISLLACGFRSFPRRSLKIGMLSYETWQNSLTCHDHILRDLYVESPFVHPSVMFRKETVVSVGGYRDAGWAEDYDLWLRLAAAGCRFGRISQSLFFWRDHPERATRTMDEYSIEAFRRCKAHHLRQNFLKDTDEVILAGAGLEGRAWQRTLAAEGVRVKLWLDVDPRKTGRILHGAPVVHASEVVPGAGKMLITVGTRGARQGVRAWATESGFQEGVDFLCVT